MAEIADSSDDLLLLGGHSSPYEPETIRSAASQNIVVLCLPPHTTRISQPLDASLKYAIDTCKKTQVML